MPTNSNQQGGGGLFARYSGEQFSPVPPGYLEAAAAQANMYASIGTNIANIIGRNREMELKKQEIEAAGQANSLKNREVQVKERDDMRKAEEANRRYLYDQDKIALEGHKAAVSGLTEELGLLKAKINEHEEGLRDPKYRNKVLSDTEISNARARMAQISVDIEAGNKTMMGLVERITGGIGNRPSIPGGGYSPFGVPGGYPLGSTQTINTNPNKPSAPTNDGAGGEGESEVYPVSEEEAKGGVPAKPETLGNTSGAANTVEQPVSQTFGSYLNQAVEFRSGASLNRLDSKGERSSQATPLKFVSVPGKAPLLVLNDSSFKFDDGGNLVLSDKYQSGRSPQERKNLEEQMRIAHLMSWAMGNPDLLSKIVPTREEKEAAVRIFIDEENKENITDIIRAYSYVTRDRSTNEPSLNWNHSALDAAFVSEFAVPTNDFVINGATRFTYGKENEIAKQIDSARGRVQELGKRTQALQSSMPGLDSIIKNPYSEQIQSLSETIGTKSRLASGVPGKAGDQLRSEVNTMAVNLQALQAASAAWENDNGASNVKLKADTIAQNLKLYTDELNNIRTLQSIQLSDREAIAQTAEKFKTWVGINPGDKERYWGYVASGVKNFKGYPVIIGGKRQLLSVSEFRAWALSDPSHGVDFERTAGLYGGSFPKIESLESMAENSIASTGAKMLNLVSSMKELHGLFVKLNRMYGLERIKASMLDPQFAGSEPLRAGLISNIRTAFIGGGNPSNFEQEILRATVPDPSSVLSFTDFNLNRLRTMAFVVMMNHARHMQAQGLEITKDSIDAYNRVFGNIIGAKITENDFLNFRSKFEKENTIYQNIPTNQRQEYGKNRVNEFLKDFQDSIISTYGDANSNKQK